MRCLAPTLTPLPPLLWQMARHRLLRLSKIAAAVLPLAAVEDAVREVVDDLGRRISADILSQARAPGRAVLSPGHPPIQHRSLEHSGL